MKIGIDAHSLEGHRTGVGRYLISLLREWSNFELPGDLQFTLYFKKEIPDDLQFLNNRFEKKILHPLWGRDSNAIFIHYLLHRAATNDKVNILFCPGYVAPILYKGNIALVLHDIIYQARPDLYNWNSWIDKILLKCFSRISAKKAKAVFVPSDFSRGEVLKHYKLDDSKVFNIPLAADESFRVIDNEEKIRNFKQKYGIEGKFALFVGSIFTRRHVPETVKAFLNVAGEDNRYQFLIVGANHTRPFVDIEELARGHNVRLSRKAVLWKDVAWRDLPLCYNAAELLVYLSDYEGFGLPVLEAMACGTPVVTTKGNSVVEVAGDAALYVENNEDISEISSAIGKALLDEQLRTRLVKNGIERARNFSWKCCAQDTIKYIQKAAR